MFVIFEVDEHTSGFQGDRPVHVREMVDPWLGYPGRIQRARLPYVVPEAQGVSGRDDQIPGHGAP